MATESRLRRFSDNVQDNYPNLPVQYDHPNTAGHVAIRIPKDDDFEQNLRVLNGLVSGHKLAVSMVADGTMWNEYWVESMSDALTAKLPGNGNGIWRRSKQ